MTRLHLAFVHGVNTGPEFDYVTSWQAALQKHLPAVEIKATAVRWRSLDNPVFDWMGLRLNTAFRVGARIDVSTALSEWLKDTFNTRRCVIAHSMGVPLAMKALNVLHADVPFVGIGSPMTHPIWGPKLEQVGFGAMPHYTPPVFSNREDYICALWAPFANIWRSPKYLKRVEVQIDAPPHKEHDAEKYLALPQVADSIYRMANVAP